MASEYLRKKAKKKAEEIEKKYGSSSYGGTTWLRNQVDDDDDIAPVADTSDSTERFQVGTNANSYKPSEEDQNDESNSIASSFLRNKAKEQEESLAYANQSKQVSQAILGTKDELSYYSTKYLQAQEAGDSASATEYWNLYKQSGKQKKANEYKAMLSEITMDGRNHSVYDEAMLVAAMADGDEKKERKRTLLKKIKSIVESGSKWDDWHNRYDDGVGIDEIFPFVADTFDALVTIGNPSKDGYDEDDVYSLLTGEAKDASFLDITWRSLTRGYDNARYGEESFKAMEGKANEKEKYEHILADDKYNFETDNWFESAIAGAAEQIGQQFRQWTNPRTLTVATGAAATAGIAGQLGPQALVPEEVVTMPGAFLAGMGAGSAAQALEIEAGLAYNEMLEAGISEETARKIALTVGTVNAGLEIFQIDELLDAYKITKATGATKNFAKKILDELVDRGVDVAKETGQEVLQEGVTIAGVQVGSEIDKGVKQYSADEVVERLGDTALSSALSFGVLNVPAGAKNIVGISNEHKAANTLTANEQKVVDKVVENEIAKREEAGEKLTSKQKSDIRNATIERMEKGYIDTDTIEEVLGGDSYKSYRDTIDSEDAQIKQLEDQLKELDGAPNTVGNSKKYDALQSQLDELKNNSQRNALKAQLDNDVYELTKGDRLRESFFEAVRAKQKYQADLSQYKGRAKKVIQSVMESGLADNTNETHDFWDSMANMAEAMDTDITLADDAQILEMVKAEHEADGLEFDESKFKGQRIDGYISKNGIVLNAKTKRALNFVVGHEITHKLEKTKHYAKLQKLLFEYAKYEYESRFNERSGQYSNKFKADDKYKAKVDKEVTADLVGDYIFNDKGFIDHLAKDRNVFQRVWDEIKYMAKIAKAGSEQAKQLERVKREFERAYREANKANNGADGTSLSLTGKNKDGIEVYETSQAVMDLTWDERKAKYLEVMKKEYLGRTAKFERNGHTYYAKFDQSSVRKPIYGDSRSSPNGVKALIKAGADGDVFDLVENSQYRGSKVNTKTHTNADYFDYFVKTVQIDGKVFDLMADVEKEYGTDEGYVYTLALVDNKKIKASPAHGTPDVVPVNNAGNAYGDKVAQKDPDVKGQFSLSDSDGRQLSNEQAEYFKDSKVRDTDGNLKVMYHGTPNGDFTIFKDGTYFTESKEYADKYQNPGASSLSTKKTASNPKTYEVYLDIKKPFDISDAEARRVYIEDYIKGGNAVGINPYLSDVEYDKINTIDWTEGEDLREFLIDNGYDYDGLVLDEGATGGYGDEVKSRGTSYVVFSPEQVKNTDNKVPTTDPDIRFSLSDIDATYMDAVNRGDMVAAQQMVNAAAKAAGYTDDASWKMQHTAPNSKDDINLVDLKDSGLVPDDYWLHPEWYTYGAEERESFYKVKKAIELQEKRMAEGNPRDARMWVYRAVDKTKNAREDFFRNGDWVTPSRDYAVNEGQMNPNGYRIIKQSVPIKDLYWDGNSIAELGYDDGNSYAYADTKNNRKLLNPVTYDYNGNIIPLSKRFNKRVDDVRYSISDEGQQHKDTGGYQYYSHIPGEDIAPVQEDAAPIIEKPAKVEPEAEAVAPVEEEATSRNDLAEIAKQSRRENFRGAYTLDGKQYLSDGGFIAEFNTVDDSLEQSNEFPIKQAIKELDESFARQVEGNYDLHTSDTKGFVKVGNSLFGTKRINALIRAFENPVFSLANVRGGHEALIVTADNGRAVLMPVRASGNAYLVYEAQPVSDAAMFPDDIAPAQTLDELMAEAQDIMGAMEAYEAVGDTAKAEQLMPEYEAVMERIGQEQRADAERVNSLDDADAPPEREAPLYSNTKPTTVADPFEGRNLSDISKRKVKAYMYENPEVKSFFQEQASIMLWDLGDTTKAERWYNDELHYASGGELGFGGNKRHTSEDIAELLDQWHMSYADIEKGLNAIIEDHGAENIAAAKKIEFLLNDRLLHGYKDFHTGKVVPPNQDYIDLLNEKQITEYSKEAFDNLVAHGDEYAPPVDGDIAPVIEESPVAEDVAPVAEQYEAIKPKPSKEPRMARATPEEQAKTAKILFDQKQTPKQKSAWKWAREHIFSRGAVFEDMSLKTGNRELQAKFDNIRRAESRAQTFIGKGKGNAKALVDVRKAVEDAGKTEDFNYYLYHLHNVDRMTLEQRFKDVPNKPVFGDSVDAEVSRKAALGLEVLNPEFKQWAEDVYAINKHLRQMMVSEGIISQETADLWQERYPHYVPISRADAKGLNVNVPLDTKRTGVNAPIKKATGGNSDFYNVFDTMGSRIEQTYKAIAKNRFGVELMNTLGTDYESDVADIDTVLEAMDQHEELLQEGKNGESPSFTVFQNGERVKFAITEDMYDAMKPSQFTYTNNALRKINDIRRDILTTYSPTFALTNPIKDVQDILLNSQHPMRTYAAIPEAIYSVISKNEWYQERMENGGKQDSYFDGQTKTFKKEDGLFKKVMGFVPSKIQAANEIIEQVPRMAEYIASRKMGRSIDVSMLDAARVTTNFGATGDLTNMLNRNGFTFLGASVEGFNQQVRNVREAKAEGTKGVMKLAAKYLVAGLPALLLNHVLWDDDEEYEELSDYVKQNYYVVAKTEDGKFIRIPKGRAVSVIQDAFKQMENLITGNDDADWESFGQLVINNLAPNNPLENNIIAPIFQVANNKTWYGDDLVPTRLQDLPAAEQYDETTDSISKWLGETFNVSPYKVNYLLDQYTGGVGDMVLPYLTPEADGGGLGAAFRDKFVTDPVLKNQNISDFYDTKDKLTTNANSMHATDEDVLMSKYMNAVNAELAELYKQKREIQNSDMSDSRKYAKVRDIQQQIVDLTKDGLNTYEDVSFEDDYREGGEYARIGDMVFKKDDDGEWGKLSDEQLTKYEVTKAAGDASYATDGENHYRWHVPEEDSDAEPGWKKITEDQLEKQEEVTKGLGISPEEYWNDKDEYDYAYKNPGNYAVAKAVGGYDSFKTYSSELYDIKADKDSYGKSISGSRKEKVIDYINGLDADYGEKIILFKSEYPSDDTYNYDIIEYLNGREDISYEEMETILKELGFKVDAKGNITWD